MAEKSPLPMKQQDTADGGWHPGGIFDALQDDLDRFWRRAGLASMLAVPSLVREGGPPRAWFPRMDVYAQDDMLVVKAELPGIKKEDVQVELDDGGLVIRGEARAESETKEGRYYRMERRMGTFYRRLPLPFEVKADQIQATVADGVLEVRLKRPTEAKPEPKRIPVS